MADRDNDGIADEFDLDADGDGVLDVLEGITETAVATADPTATGATATVGSTSITYTETAGNIVQYTSNGGSDIPVGAESNTIAGFDLGGEQHPHGRFRSERDQRRLLLDRRSRPARENLDRGL